MHQFLYHYIYQDLWTPTWPNWFAGFVAAVLVSYFGKRIVNDIHNHLNRNHEALKDHITDTLNGSK
jgi:hypothetical protein